MNIIVGKKTPEHKNDTSRELFSLWAKYDFCQVKYSEVDYFTWADNGQKKILLYEYDRWDAFPFLPISWSDGLFGGMQHPNGLPWIYWGRHPFVLEQKSCFLKPYSDRSILSIFLGKVENNVQMNHRTIQDWSLYIEKFDMPILMGDSYTWKYSQEEYLELVSNSRFGLCLPGFGPKCNREIEYFALGVVPIVVSEHTCLRYHDPLIEDFHYLSIKNPCDIKKELNNCSKDRWEFLSYNGKKWFDNNCSIRGSYETTEKIIRSLI